MAAIGPFFTVHHQATVVGTCQTATNGVQDADAGDAQGVDGESDLQNSLRQIWSFVVPGL
eukprot:CAMPEP_0115147150 /NCGR_PEP_ID=MMETSP0227-20121206/63133_1 /TAXON_ID=89957 /ORGANISM="Polarella glacialis, Strain CCMP 1383" /LENGTH=59 /DNA_ID=CAMNT_0002556991 /DNA_START=546 /DNA_END=725 /DNA_ORIENTATION=+